MINTTQSNKTHLTYIDGLRGLAAIYVVMHHAAIHFSLNNLTYWQKLLLAPFKSGHYAVDLFIVISGFSLMIPAIKRDYKLGGVLDFYKRRVKRILPPYYITLIISALLILSIINQKTGTRWDISIPITIESFITHVLLINDLFLSHVYKFNHSFWSISVECRIYIIFPLLLFVWRKYSPIATLGVSILISFLLFVTLLKLRVYFPDIDLITSGVNPYIILFTLGMIAADISFSQSKIAVLCQRLPWGSALIVSVLAFVVYKSTITFKTNLNGNVESEIVDVLVGLICFCLLIVCSKNKYDQSPFRLLKQLFSLKPIVFMGLYAYSIYLIHAPILQILSQYLTPVLHLKPFYESLALIATGTISVLIIGYVFFLFFERPFLNKPKKL